MISRIRQVSTGVLIAVRAGLSQDDLIEVVSIMVVLLSIVVELLTRWLDSRKTPG